MSKLSLPALGCLSLLALGLSVATPAFAEDAPADETPVADGGDPGVDPGAEPGVDEGGGDPGVEVDPDVTYDPEIAQSGAGVPGGPEVQRGGGSGAGAAISATGRTDSDRSGTGVITGKIIIKIAD